MTGQIGGLSVCVCVASKSMNGLGAIYKAAPIEGWKDRRTSGRTDG